MSAYSVTVKVTDWWGNSMTTQPSSPQKYLLSSTGCEKETEMTLTLTGNGASTYKLNDNTVEYSYSVAALSPSNCKFTLTAGTIPVAISSHVAHTASTTTTGKFKLTKVSSPNTLAGTYDLTV